MFLAMTFSGSVVADVESERVLQLNSIQLDLSLHHYVETPV